MFSVAVFIAFAVFVGAAFIFHARVVCYVAADALDFSALIIRAIISLIAC